MSPNLLPVSAIVAIENPPTTQLRAANRANGKVLQSAVFHTRRARLNLAGMLRPIVAKAGPSSPEAFVIAAAEKLANESGAHFPARWLLGLKTKIGKAGAEAQANAEAALQALPRAAWHEASLLGEVLNIARTELSKSERKGRAGRVSAGCVYTPAAVARQIIAETHVGARRVVDPACGAGVFLLEAFERGFRRRQEAGAGPQEAARATLQHEIAGMDIDSSALAVAEFSLRMLAFRLSGMDEDVPIALKNVDALKSHPEFDGQCECVVGNPPFVEGRGLDQAQLDYLRENFRAVAHGKVNLFAAFVERSLTLLKEDGVMALIVPATFQRNTRYRALREILLQHTIESIKHLDANCFGERIVETVVLRVRKKPPLKSSRVQLHDGRLLQSRLPMGPVLRFCDHLPRALRRQVELMERHGVPLCEHFEVRDGISTGFQPFPNRLLGRNEERGGNSLFVPGDGEAKVFNPEVHRKIIDGCEFNSFTPIQWAGRYIEYDKTHEHTPPHPGRPFNCQLRERAIYDRAEKLLTRQTARGIIATIDRDRYFVRNSVHVTYQRPGPLELSLDALCACLNTQFYTNYLLAVTGENGEVFPQVHIADLRRLPLLPGLLKKEGHLAKLGQGMLEAHRNPEESRDEIARLKAETEMLLSDAFGI